MKILLLATAAIGLAAAPALAKGNPHGGHGGMMKGHGHASMMGSQHRHSSLSDGYRDRNRDGADDRFENRDSHRYGANNCPPGLAKKNNGCMAPGQAKRLFRRGQRVPTGYNYFTDYNNIPAQYRDRYNLDPNSRYIYRNDQIYVVDPRTNLVSQVLSGLIR